MRAALHLPGTPIQKLWGSVIWGDEWAAEEEENKAWKREKQQRKRKMAKERSSVSGGKGGTRKEKERGSGCHRKAWGVCKSAA